MTSSKRKKFRLKLSVIIPVYNAQNTIERTIKSMIRASYDYYPDEILVVNDCSQDNSFKVLLQLARKYSHIRIINLHHNIGASEARHIGVLASKNELLSFVDSDDYLEANTLARSYFSLKGSKADFCLFRMFGVNQSGDVTCKHNYYDIPFPLEGQSAIKYTVAKWDISALGIFRKTNYLQAYNNIHSSYYRKDELLSRETLRLSTKIVLSDSRYYYVFNASSITNIEDEFDFKRISFNNLLTEWALKHDALDGNIEQTRLHVSKSIGLSIKCLFKTEQNKNLTMSEFKQNVYLVCIAQFYISKVIARIGFFSFGFRTFAKFALVFFGLIFYLIYWVYNIFKGDFSLRY